MIDVPQRFGAQRLLVSTLHIHTQTTTSMISLIMVNMYNVCINLHYVGTQVMSVRITTELNKELQLEPSLTPEDTTNVQQLVIKYWDCFVKEGARRLVWDISLSLILVVPSRYVVKNLHMDLTNSRSA